MKEIDPDRACPHENFLAETEVQRIKESEEAAVSGFLAEMRIWCSDCGETFRWMGLQAGLAPDHPMCSPDEATMRAPIRPASSDPDFGLGLPGFAIFSIREPEEPEEFPRGPGSW